MTSDRDKCGLSSLLPMSCRGRAEAFARRLQSRLRSLGSHDGNGAADESSWLAAHENPIAISQPRHSSDSDLYFDLGALESPNSPEEELESSELEKLINKDGFKLSHSEDCHCAATKNIPLLNSVKATSNDSDSSDGPFYDTDTGDQNSVMNNVNGVSHSSSGGDVSEGADEGADSNQTEELFATTSECTMPPCSPSLSEDVSTLSLNRDEEFGSLELNGSVPELPQSEEATEAQEDDSETYRSCLSVEKDLTVECPDELQVVVSSAECVEVSEEPASERVDDYDADAEAEERIPRVRRCSSLKTGKTPPGTPGRKKIVRFADVLGLDLADVRTFLDEIPKVPTSAYEDLKDVDLGEPEQTPSLSQAHKFHGIKVDKVLVPLFQQPGGQPNFLDRVRDSFVCLENAMVEDPMALSITGMVRVRNLDFHKSVHIRYSLDSWQSFADVQGVYLENSCDGFSDKFSFLMYAHTLAVGQRIEFAVRFQCKGCQYWDNNNGANYCFQCLPATSTSYAPITGVDDAWGASFYYQEDSSDTADVDVTDVTHTAVQEFITHSLGTKHEPPRKKSDMTTVLVVLIFSILFMYLQKAIYFAK